MKYNATHLLEQGLHGLMVYLLQVRFPDGIEKKMAKTERGRDGRRFDHRIGCCHLLL